MSRLADENSEVVSRAERRDRKRRKRMTLHGRGLKPVDGLPTRKRRIK